MSILFASAPLIAFVWVIIDDFRTGVDNDPEV